MIPIGPYPPELSTPLVGIVFLLLLISGAVYWYQSNRKDQGNHDDA